MSSEDRAAGPAGKTGGREETGNTHNHLSSPGYTAQDVSTFVVIDSDFKMNSVL